MQKIARATKRIDLHGVNVHEPDNLESKNSLPNKVQGAISAVGRTCKNREKLQEVQTCSLRSTSFGRCVPPSPMLLIASAMLNLSHNHSFSSRRMRGTLQLVKNFECAYEPLRFCKKHANKCFLPFILNRVLYIVAQIIERLYASLKSKQSKIEIKCSESIASKPLL